MMGQPISGQASLWCYSSLGICDGKCRPIELETCQAWTRHHPGIKGIIGNSSCFPFRPFSVVSHFSNVISQPLLGLQNAPALMVLHFCFYIFCLRGLSSLFCTQAWLFGNLMFRCNPQVTVSLFQERDDNMTKLNSICNEVVKQNMREIQK